MEKGIILNIFVFHVCVFIVVFSSSQIRIYHILSLIVTEND